MLPTLSIIVPSFNQAAYLEETLLSIINQQYPQLQLIVIDGGSTDGSVDIIRRYEKHIAYWVSQPDRGQSHAINKGLEKATGEWVAWMNSDDCYLPGALSGIFAENHTHHDFIYGSCLVGTNLENTRQGANNVADKDSLFDILLFFHATRHIIPSQSVFIRKTLINKIGFLQEGLQYCMDLEWYCRVFLATNKRKFYEKPVCFFRKLPSTKTSSHGGKMIEEAMAIAEQYVIYLPEKLQQKLKKCLAYDTMLFDSINKGDLNLPKMLEILIRWPGIALSDIRFRTRLKKKLI